MLLAALALALPQGPVPTGPAPPTQESGVEAKRRAFDFWLGEWSVLNRHLGPDGSWKDGPRGRARISPVLGGRAVLEEWGSDMHWGGHLNGFSLRAYDAERDQWDLLLYWHTDGRSSFGRLRGGFRHGRGTFFTRARTPDGGERVTRYTFSDALPDTVRWDSAVSTDGERTWRTDWIMEFTRTAPASAVSQDRALAETFEEGTVTASPASRERDAFDGAWSGSGTRGGEEVDVRLRCRAILKGAAHVELLETRPPGDAGAAWRQALTVRAVDARRGAWEAWRLTGERTTFRRSLEEGDGGRAFRADGGGPLETWTLEGDGALRIEIRGEAGPVATYALRRE